MAVSWIVLLVSAAVLIALILLAFTCLDCRNKAPLAFIPQGNASEEYIPSTQFRVIHPSQSASVIHSPTNLLSPQSSSSNPGIHQRHPSYAPTETESNPSYENPVPGSEFIESDAEDGYIHVLPEIVAPPSNRSRASSMSSDSQHNYENVVQTERETYQNEDDSPDMDQDPGSGDYLNVEPVICSSSTPDMSSQSDSDDSDAYVNQP